MARAITLIDLVAVALVDCDVEAVPGLLIAQLCVLAGSVCVLPHTNDAKAHTWEGDGVERRAQGRRDAVSGGKRRDGAEAQQQMVQGRAGPHGQRHHGR